MGKRNSEVIYSIKKKKKMPILNILLTFHTFPYNLKILWKKNILSIKQAIIFKQIEKLKF